MKYSDRFWIGSMFCTLMCFVVGEPYSYIFGVGAIIDFIAMLVTLRDNE